MKYVFIAVQKGRIREAAFFDDPAEAVKALAAEVRNMNHETDDAAVYSVQGLITTAAALLDWHDKVTGKDQTLKAEVA